MIILYNNSCCDLSCTKFKDEMPKIASLLGVYIMYVVQSS